MDTQSHQMKRSIEMKQLDGCTMVNPKPNQVGTVLLYGIPIVSLFIESQERLCLAQISNTLLKQFSYNEIHNRRVALGITCVQCTPVQLEILRRAGAMPVSSRRCGMITRREAERLCKSFLGDNAPPRLPDDFAFTVHHECAWGCRGSFLPARYNSSRAKCIKCSYCGLFFSPNKFIFHSHRIGPSDKYIQPDAANFNSWRRHMKLSGNPPEEIIHAWEDVKAMFNGGTRKRLIGTSSASSSSMSPSSPKRFKEIPQMSPPNQQIHQRCITPQPIVTQTFPIKPINIHPNQSQRISNDIPLTFSRTFMMDYMWHTQNKTNSFHFPPYALPWLKRPGSLIFNNHEVPPPPPPPPQQPPASSTTASSTTTTTTTTTTNSNNQSSSSDLDNKRLQFYNHSAFKPVNSTVTSRNDDYLISESSAVKESLSSDDEMVDIETTEDEIIFMNKQKKNNIRCLILDDDCDDDDEDDDDDDDDGIDVDSLNDKQKNWNAEPMKKESSDIQPSTSIHQQTKVDSSLILSSRTSNTIENSPKSTADTLFGLSSTITASTCTNNVNDLWSVARLSLDRTDTSNNETFYHRTDMSKHFQNFCHSDSSHSHGIV